MKSVSAYNPFAQLGLANTADLLEAAPGRGVSRGRKTELRETCQEFESIFLRQMLKDMRRILSRGGIVGKGFQGETYNSLFEEQLARVLAEGRGIGLGDRLYRQLAARFKDEMDGEKTPSDGPHERP